MSAPTKAPAFACELFKLARGRWVTKPDIEHELRVADITVLAWIKEYVAQGILVERQQPRNPRKVGVPPMEYTLAAQWGGAE